MKKYLLHIFLPLQVSMLAFPLSSFGQNPQEELKKINAAYQHKTLGFEMQYKCYINYTAANPIDEIKGKFLVSGNTYYQQTADVVTLCDGVHFIQVAPETQTILVSDYTPRPSSPLPIDISGFLGDHLRLSSSRSGMLQLTLSMAGLHIGYEKIVLLYDTSTYHIKKTILYYEESMSLDEEEKLPPSKPRMEITYILIPNPSIQEHVKNRYFTQSANGLVLLPPYQGYELVDNRSVKSFKKKSKRAN